MRTYIVKFFFASNWIYNRKWRLSSTTSKVLGIHVTNYTKNRPEDRYYTHILITPRTRLRLEKLIKSEHKITPETLSEKNFQLPGEYKGIINHIAKNGPSILNEITEKTENLGKWKCSRKAANIRINGSSQKFGMIDCEYLISKDPKSSRHGNAKDVYFLTTKGMLAALSTCARTRWYSSRLSGDPCGPSQ